MIPRSDPRVEMSLRKASALVEAAAAFSFALEDFAAIELPPSSGSAMDQAQLRAIAALYLASELEAARVIPAAEDLIALARAGTLAIDLGSAAASLEQYWRARNERASEAERQSFFAGLFGVSSGASPVGGRANIEFEDRLIDLCEALYKLDEQAANPGWGGVAQQARVRSAADHLLENLAHSANGSTAFLAKEILGTLRDALALLNHPSIVAAFGARSAREVIAAINRRLRRTANGFDLHARRGQSGMTILAWLADAAPLLESRQPLVGLDHPVIGAAVEWLEASLNLTETETPAVPAGRRNDGDPAGTWAALAM